MLFISTQVMPGELINSTYNFKLVQLGTLVTVHQSGILPKWKESATFSEYRNECYAFEMCLSNEGKLVKGGCNFCYR